MSLSGSRFKLLGLCLLVPCGLSAVMAVSAQGNWLENGKEITATKEVKAKAHTTTVFSIPKLNFEFRCTTLEAKELKLLVGTATTATAEGKVAFSGCTAFSKGVAAPLCNPEKQPIVAGGLSLVKLLALTKGGILLNVLLYEQKGTEPFTTITLGEECSLAKTSNMTGSIVFECGLLEPVNTFKQEDCKTSRAVHLVQAPAQTVWFSGKEDSEEVKDELKFGANPETLGGIAAAELVSGNPWGGEV